MSEHWEAAVEAVADAISDYLPGDAKAYKLEAIACVDAALPHLRRHIIAELREKAEAEATRAHEAFRSADEAYLTATTEAEGETACNERYELGLVETIAGNAAVWLAAQEATDD